MKNLAKAIQKHRAKANISEDFRLVIESAVDAILSQKISELEKEINKELGRFFKIIADSKDKIQKDIEKAVRSEEIQTIIQKSVNSLIGRGLRGEQGMRGLTGPQGESIIGPKGEKGDDYILTKRDMKEIAELVPSGKDGKDGSSDTPDQIATKINTLEEKIEQKTIKGLIKFLNNIQNSIREARIRPQGGGGNVVEYYDLSSQLNGVLKTFTIPTNRRVLSIHASSFPFSAFRPTIDYSSTRTTITFTSEINAATTLATNQSLILELIN